MKLPTDDPITRIIKKRLADEFYERHFPRPKPLIYPHGKPRWDIDGWRRMLIIRCARQRRLGALRYWQCRERRLQRKRP